MRPNETKKPGLTDRQLRAISALLEEPTIFLAAGRAGVGKATLFRWLNDPAFSEAYRAARGRLLEDVLTSLQSASIDAVIVLREIMTDKDINAFARVSAARGVLELSLKAREIIEVDARLRALEDSLIGKTNQIPWRS